MVEFVLSEKTFNDRSLENRSSVDTKSEIIKNPTGVIPADLSTPM